MTMQTGFWAGWTAIEILSSVLTPVAILGATTIFTYWSRRREERAHKLSEIAAKRVELWDRIAIPRNDIYTYMLFVGHWKDLTAADALARAYSTPGSARRRSATSRARRSFVSPSTSRSTCT